MQRTGAGRGSADLDGLGRVRTAREVEPVAEAGGVVEEPGNRRGNKSGAGQPEIRRAAQAAALQQCEADAGPGEQGDDPAVIARIDGGDESGGYEELQLGRLDWVFVKAKTPLHKPDHDPDDFAEEERLGHGRGLEVEQIGIEREECERERGGRGVEPVARQAIDAGAGGEVGQGRGNDAGEAAGPPRVILHKGHEQNVRQWEPHRAELAETRGARVEDAARDVKVRDGVAVVEHGRVIPAPDDGGKRGCHGEGEDQRAFGVRDAAVSQGA